MSSEQRILVISFLLATLSGLLSDVTAGYLTPWLDNRAWLTFTVCLLIAGIGIYLAIFQGHKTASAQIRLQHVVGEATLRELLSRLVPELRDPRERNAFLQLAITPDTAPLYDEVDLTGAPMPFTIKLLETLLKERWFAQGKQLLAALLTVVAEHTGDEKTAQTLALSTKIEQLQYPTAVLVRQLPLTRYFTARIRIYLIILPVLAIAVTIFGPTVSRVWAQHAPSCPPDRICLLIARFNVNEEDVTYQVTQELVHQIRSILDASRGRRFTVLEVDPVNDADSARRLARSHRAPLIVWGQVAPLPASAARQVRVNFELVDLLGIGGAEDLRTYRIEPFGYDPISHTVTCPNCTYLEINQQVDQPVNFVAYTAIGLLNYLYGWPEDAQLNLLAALACAGYSSQIKVIGATPPTCRHATSKIDVNLSLIYYYLGKALLLQGNYQETIRMLEKATALNPQDPAALIGIGVAHQSWASPMAVDAVTHSFRQAQEQLTTLLNSATVPYYAHPILYYDRGLLFEVMTAYTEAQADFQVAADLLGNQDQQAYTPLVGLGRAARKAGNDAVAQHALESAAQFAPKWPWAYLELALLHHENRKASEAYLRSAQVSYRDVYTDIIQAQLCRDWHDQACAENAYAQALGKRPNSGWLHTQVGDYYRTRKPELSSSDWQQVLMHYRRATELRPCDPTAHERLAYFYAASPYTNDTQAAEHYQRAILLSHPQADTTILRDNLQRVLSRAKLTVSNFSSGSSICQIME